MADFLSFNEGRKAIWDIDQGSVASFTTSFLALSVKDTSTLLVTDTLAGGFGEVNSTTTSTGYIRFPQATPTASAANPAVISFVQASFATGAATDWPSFVKSAVLITGSSYSASHRLVCAWNLQTGGTARNLAAAGITELFTPTLNIA